LQSHRTNLAVRSLSGLAVVNRIEDLLQSLHTYFARSPKRHLEFVKLAEVLEMKGLKILRQVKTRWLSMMSPAIRVMNEYRTLVVKMMEDQNDVDSAKTSFHHLIDIQIVLSLSSLIPMLKSLHQSTQLGQKRDVYICDYLDALKQCQANITAFYINDKSKYQHDVFWDFKALARLRHEAIPMRWVYNALNLNTDACEYLYITPIGHSIRCAHRDLVTGESEPITHDLFLKIVEDVKEQSTGALAIFLPFCTDSKKVVAIQYCFSFFFFFFPWIFMYARNLDFYSKCYGACIP
jgi:hypothetical protein